MDRAERSAAARRSWEGLSVGDALGKAFFLDRPDAPEALVAARRLPPPPWPFTDDTVMAASLVEILERHGRVASDALAAAFAARFTREPERGYGAVAYWLLHRLAEGGRWEELSPGLFRGQGSKGNGAAMRVAPLGAHFADDLERVVLEARRSAEVTHHHPEGVAGAVAVAVAAALWSRAELPPDPLAAVIAATPAGPTRDGLERARAGGFPASDAAAAALGAGQQVLAEDTVPFALWCATARPDDYGEAAWTALAGLLDPDSDRDTVLAIVGGVVGLRSAPPEPWRAAREPLPELE